MRRNGFTLVEMMAVVAIMAVMASAVILVSGPMGGGPGDAASRFASRVAAARDQAIVTARPTGAWVTQSGYGFDEYRDGAWRDLSSRTLRQRDWDSGTSVTLGSASEGQGRLRFDTLGLPESPLTVTLARGGQSARVIVAANGDVEVRR